MPESPPNAQHLAAAFLAASGLRDPPGDLGERLVALVGSARAAHPEIRLDDEVFTRHLAQHLPEGATLDARLGVICAGDLYLACACAAGVLAAIETLDRQYRPQVGSFLAPLHPAPDFVEDVAQAVLERLLTRAEGRPPKIAEYSGRGPLAAWLRVVTVRAAVNLRRKRTEELVLESEEELPEPLPDTPQDPEGELLKQRYSGVYNAAFLAAASALTTEQQDLLRLHYAEGMKVEELERKLGVSRATIFRRIDAAKKEILTRARRVLRENLDLRPDEVESLMRLMRSQLDLSFSSAFRKKPK